MESLVGTQGTYECVQSISKSNSIKFLWVSAQSSTLALPNTHRRRRVERTTRTTESTKIEAVQRVSMLETFGDLDIYGRCH